MPDAAKYLTEKRLPRRYVGGWNPPIGLEIACHFSQDHAMVTKILDFIHKHPKYPQIMDGWPLTFPIFTFNF